MKPEIIFVGAGAIGRGFLPWIFSDGEYDFVFVDSNGTIVDRMNDAHRSTSLMAKGGSLERLVFKVKSAFLPIDFHIRDHTLAAAIFVQVGPRDCLQAVSSLKGTQAPIVLCENDSNLVGTARQYLHMENIFFGVPDVITSNIAPPHELAIDPLTVMTEDGVLYVDEQAGRSELRGNIRFIPNRELLETQWKAKLYLHNTPHCIAAYLGALLNKQYLHEAMEVPEVSSMVEGVMREMLTSLKLTWDIPHEFLDWYAHKELSRFRNKLLYDPIARVAREPIRKLELDGRLIGAANICLSKGFIPENIFAGIVAALLFEGKGDKDRHLAFVRDSVHRDFLLTYVLGLRKGEAVELALSDSYENINRRLLALVEKRKAG